jgi:predicted small secreted protein
MRRSIGWLALVGAVALPAPALAETLRATSEAETGPGSLGETILEAGPGDTIELGPGEYPLTEGDTLLAQGNTIRGAGEDVTSILPTGGGDAVSSANVINATILPAEKGGGDGGAIETKTQIFAVLGTLAIFLLILELVRRRRLVERYALLWLAAGLALLVLSIWTDGLDVIADAMGVEEPANAIFILAFGVAFLLLLNFSVATSRLSEETKILAQETARLEQELRAARGEVPSPNGGAGVEAAPEREREHT